MCVLVVTGKNSLIVRKFSAFRSGRQSLRGSSCSSTQGLRDCTYVVSGFSDCGGLHFRISGFQVRKRYHNQQSAYRQRRKHVEGSYLFREQQSTNRCCGK